ncbi:PIN domain-like protein [Chlamydoabsidia padenii]|nr:PIN domain-like protein [Chlamydoabsidia padenii]
MGITGLTGLLKRHAPQSLTRTLTQQYRGQTVAIDASCPMNRFIYGDDPHPYRHIQGFYLLAKYCDRHDIKPIFVFDGKERLPAKQQWEHRRRARGQLKVRSSLVFEQSRSTRLAAWLAAADDLNLLTPDTTALVLDQLKGVDGNDELSELARLAQELYRTNQRVQDRERYTKTVRDLSDQEYSLMETMVRQRMDSVQDDLMDLKRQNDRLLVSYEKRARRITETIKQESFSFLSSLGYPCLVCEKHEAEAMCANLVYHGKADNIVSEDMDSIVFGDAPLLRYFCTKNKQILQVDPVVARQQLGLTKAGFLDLCILCGTDFGSKIAGVGPMRALQLIKQYGSIEDILYHLDPRKYIPEEGFDYRLIRKIFQDLPPIPLITNMMAPVDDLDQLLQQYQIDPDEIDQQLDLIMHLEHKPDDTDGFGHNPFSAPTSTLGGHLSLFP